MSCPRVTTITDLTGYSQSFQQALPWAIITAGICRVVYLEPYPKSHAADLHDDAIDVEERDQSGKVEFEDRSAELEALELAETDFPQ